MQNIDTKKIETADENILAAMNDIRKILSEDNWKYERTNIDLKDDKTLKVTTSGFTMFELRAIGDALDGHHALWYIGTGETSLDVTLTAFVH